MADRKLAPSLSVLVAALLAGCAVGPDYHEPAAQVPQQFVGAETARYTTQDGDLASFWTGWSAKRCWVTTTCTLPWRD